jgi:hypothetical protein
LCAVRKHFEQTGDTFAQNRQLSSRRRHGERVAQ